ncbi:hypothetical protein [Desulfovibrio subterraneus]|uniref:Lipoprotein n=1 Tax=Desulfovibrio subterraneus TaxID=2718620 RepID=A0A7J0BMI4_9BACT|nr:hypothetical protein [Desulfovibrio subterraneus]GFM34896.1 hypothetical protein DSM101010T_32610 [Desulfovibrio subterraneus]
MVVRFVVLSLFLALAGGCGRTYKVQDYNPVEFGVYSMDVPTSLTTRVMYTRINDAILRELPKSKIDSSSTARGIAAKKLFLTCNDASKCRLMVPDELPMDTMTARVGLPANMSIVAEGDLFWGAAFETDLGYIWLNYLKPVSTDTFISDIMLAQRNYKPATVGSYRTRYGALEQAGDITHWQTVVQGKDSSGSLELSVYYAKEPLNSDKHMIDLKTGTSTHEKFGHKAEYTRKRKVCGFEGTEWMAEGILPNIRYYEWFFEGDMPDVGRVHLDVSLKGSLSRDEGWHEAVWNFVLNSMRLQAAHQ